MGSTFVTINPSRTDSRQLFANTKPQPVYLQFVPGIVGDVVTSGESKASGGLNRNLNSILAKPHVGNKFKKTGLLDEEDRYFPLLRGIQDVPMIGDPVLLCTFGGVNYYLGPVNTAGLPTFNPDHLQKSDIIGIYDNELATSERGKKTMNDMIGKSDNWRDAAAAQRLEKAYNMELDDPGNERAHFVHPKSGNTILNDTHGDLMFEGRHGNSIRIGSRDVNPYIIFSNNNSERVENLKNGSVFAILDKGTIRQHFSRDPIEFVLADGNPEVNESVRMIDADTYNYNFGSLDMVENQLFLNSDRITINSRRNNIFLSAYKDIIIGTGDSFIVKTNNNIIFDGKNIYLGQEATEEVEPIVLGQELVTVLGELIDAIGQIFVPATIGGVSGPVSGGGSPGWLQLDTMVRNKLKSVLSNFHYIETNETQK